MSTILVTGGCGFVGSNLIPLLLADGHDVTVFDNLSNGSVSNIPNSSECEFIEGDIRNRLALKSALRGKDVVIHLAAFGSVVDSVSDPDENFDINVAGTFNVLSAAQSESVKRVLFSSTGGALIGNAQPPVNENSVPKPISPYGASKLACEGYCSAFAGSYGMNITAFRFANVVGPISWHKKGAVTSFFKAIMESKPIRIFGDGKSTRDYLYVGDLCDGIVRGMKADLPGFNAFHLASGREVSVSELAGICCNVADADSHEIIYEDKRAGEVERNFADYSLAKATLGFSPKISLEEGLAHTWQWFQSESKLNHLS